MGWALWGEVLESGEARRYDPPRPVEGRLPIQVEYSGDGCWASLYEGKNPIRTWMWQSPARGQAPPDLAAKKVRKELAKP